MKNTISLNLKALNQKATKIFMKIIDGIPDDAAKYIGNKGGCIMQVVVEKIYHENIYGKVYSIGHYYTQMGDRMSDPEMTFLVNDDDGKVYPLTFEQHGTFARYEPNCTFDEDGKLQGIYQGRPNKHKNFANMWMNNIKFQQKL